MRFLRDVIVTMLAAFLLVCALFAMSYSDAAASDRGTGPAPVPMTVSVSVESCFDGGPNGLISANGAARVWVGSDYADIPDPGGALSFPPGDYIVQLADHEVVVTIGECQLPEPKGGIGHPLETSRPTLPPTDTL